jgi:hypothetical protein
MRRLKKRAESGVVGEREGERAEGEGGILEGVPMARQQPM